MASVPSVPHEGPMTTSCPKCGRDMNGPFWHEKRPFPQSAACGHRDVARKNSEHLHFYCICGFDRTGPILKTADE